MVSNMGTNAYMVFSTTPFDGYKLGSQFANKKMVAVPKKRMEEAKELGKDLCIFQKAGKYDKKSKKNNSSVPPYMVLPSDELPQAYGEFEDKWGREGKYILYYFEWKPITQSTLF